VRRLLVAAMICWGAGLVACAGSGLQMRDQPPGPERRATGPAAGRRAGTGTPAPEGVRAGTAAADSGQRLLDEALELCEAARSLWARGELDQAVETLDRAYQLVLKARPDHDDDLERQRQDLRLTIAKRLLEIHAARQSTVAGVDRPIPLDLNDEVRREIETFLGPQRRFLLASYRRSGRYRKMILRQLEQAGLPRELAWLPLIESGFKIRALSTARALGLWQFIPSTGYRFGLKRDHWVDERMDAVKSTRAAVEYLTELHKLFGDWSTALAAYNCGENLVLRVIRRQDINYLDNFWDLYRKLPEQTRRYVPRFLAVLHILRDPAKYQVKLPAPEEPPDVVPVVVDKPLHLKTLARELGVAQKLLAELNPALRRQVTPPRAYSLLVPRARSAGLAERIAKLPAYKPPQPVYLAHRIKQGETLSHLARRYRVSIDTIARVNHIKPGSILRIGQKLRIPNRAAGHPRPPPPSRKPPPPRRGLVTVEVKPGDSLWKLARRYHSDVDSIQELNGLRDYKLSVGQRLRIRPGSGSGAGNGDASYSRYTVKPGDTLFSIARNHGMDLAELLRLNHMRPSDPIRPGQVLRIRRAGGQASTPGDG